MQRRDSELDNACAIVFPGKRLACQPYKATESPIGQRGHSPSFPLTTRHAELNQSIPFINVSTWTPVTEPKCLGEGRNLTDWSCAWLAEADTTCARAALRAALGEIKLVKEDGVVYAEFQDVVERMLMAVGAESPNLVVGARFETRLRTWIVRRRM